MTINKDPKTLLAIFLLALLSLIILSSCQTRYITQDHRSTDTLYLTKYKTTTDSIYNYDSIYIREKGDTLYVENIKYRYKYLYKTQTDTIYKSSTDTVYIEVAKPTKPEKKSIIDKAKDISSLIGLIAVVYALTRLYLKRK